jgi:photosystem II stability/assembly factor-like uncharacterized protein
MWRTFVALAASMTLVSACARGEPTVIAVAVHPTNPQIVYVSSSHGVLKTRDGAATWSPINEGLEHSQVLAFAIDPTAPSTVYAGTFANAIYKSSDGGQLWRPANVGMKEHVSVVNAFAIYPPNPQEIYAATTVGVYGSTDGGASWEETVSGMESVYTVAIAFDPQTPEILYAGTSGGMYKSRDRGSRWEIINQGLIEGAVGTAMKLGVNAISVAPDQPNNVVIATGKGIYLSRNGGGSWESRTTGQSESSMTLLQRTILQVQRLLGFTGQAVPFMTALQRDPADHARLYAGGDKGVFISSDRGETWSAVNAEPRPGVVRALAVDPSTPGVVYAGTQRGLFKSADSGGTWLQVEGLR